MSLQKWLPGEKLPPIFGVDRSPGPPGTNWWDRPARKPTLRERVRSAWTGLVSGWRWP